eukprot:Gb_24680 [translate_table: standard]
MLKMITELLVKVFATVMGVGLLLWVLTKCLLDRGQRETQPPDDHSSDSEEDTPAKPIPANKSFDVFLSFRGPDIRKTFVGHLDHSLSASGVNVFLDSKKLEKGKKIDMSLEHAIRNSDILIPIFSKNYASSRWCLDEVSQMYRAHAKLIIPIFYDVKPEEVRHQTGPFEAAFNKHRGKGRANEETIQGWRDSLKNVCSFSGWSLQDDFNGYEIKLVKTLTTQILGKLKKLPLPVATHPVGVEERKKVAMDLLEMESEGIIISLCIHGMGGVGKTTLAKALFNDLCPKFSATSFMSDVRKTDTKELQMNIITRLVNTVNKDDVKINCPEEGMNEMKKHLDRVRALLVLDDVDDPNVLAALLGDWFLPGSRIIVTTRNKGVLDQRSKHLNRFYQVEGLDDDQALKLFISHAFPERDPNKEYRRLSEQVVKACKGLPLAIEVIGGFLFDKRDPKVWDEAMKQLKSVEIIEDRLKMSYNVLNPTEKEIFLDIACFFVGSATSINACAYGKLRMHDILRDMGRSIVTKQSISDIGERSRLWDEKDATKSIQGILYTSSKRKSFRTEQMEAMHNLRLLSLNNAIIEGDFGRIPTSELRWLRWIDCPLECLPSELKMKNIAVLEVTQSRQIRQVWVDEQMHPKIPKTLKILRIADCFNLERLPEFSKLRSLNLEGLPRSIGSLVRLRFLIMYKNCSLRCLPEEFGRLLQLEELNLSECETLVELPQSFGNLSNLTVLRMNNMRNLTRPPESISDLGALRILEVQRASRLQELPNIGMLKSLGLLNLSYNCFHTLPESIIHLSQLTKLRLSHYSNLSKLPVLPERLVELVIEKCGYLRRVPDLSNLKHLEILVMYECKRVEGLPGLGSLQALVYLDIGRCYDIKSVAGVEGLKSLQRLHLGGSGVAFFHKWIKAINGQVMPRLWELSFDAKPFRDWFSQQIQTAPPSLDENGEYITFLEQGQNVRCMGAIFFFVGIQLSVSVIRGGRYAFSSTQFTSRTSFNRYRDFGGEEMRLFICQENDEFIKSLQNGDKIRFGVDENVTSPIVWINFLSSTGEEIIRSGSEDSSKQQNSKLYCEFFRDMAWIQWSYNAWRNLHPLDFNMRSFAVYDLAGFIRRTFNSKSLGSGNVVQETVFVRCKRELWFEVEGELVEKDKKLSGGKSDRWMEWKKQSERERERVRRVRRREMVGMQERPSMRVGYATASGCARTVVNTICEKVAQIRKVSRTWYGRMDQEEHLGQLYSQGRTVAPVPSGTQIKLATSLTRLSRS